LRGTPARYVRLVGHGNTQSAWNSLTEVALFGTPLAPEQLTIQAVSQTQLDLQWQDRSANEAGFIVEYRRSTDSMFTRLDTLPANTTAYSSLMLQPGTSYTYRVLSFNTLGQTASVEAGAAAFPVGTGLLGAYYTNKYLLGKPLTQVDSTINFDWAAGSPQASLPPNGFSVRWLGQVQPRYSEVYTFRTLTDDGVKLWINGQLLVNSWKQQSATHCQGTISLEANRKYDIKVEYYEHNGLATAKLFWSSASQAEEIIPRSQLFPLESVPAEALSFYSDSGFAERGAVTLYPNPVSEFCRIRFPTALTAPAQVVVTDLLFRKVLQWSPPWSEGQTELTLNLGSLPNGHYLIIINSGQTRHFAKVVVAQ
jgi:hypothetical protein